MVASSSTRSAFNTVDSVLVNGDSRRVCPYPANQPSHIRTWEEHFKAHLDAKDITFRKYAANLYGVAIADV